MSRADEIAQGLRDETGSLIGGLDVLDYTQGHRDHDIGADRPRISSTSYDLGWARASRLAEEKADVLAAINADADRKRNAAREMLKDHPEILADFDRSIATLNAKSAATPKDDGAL